MSSEDFKNISVWGKIKLLTKKLKHASQENKTLPILFLASTISKLYFVLFSNFWLLYLTSFVGDLYDEKGAKKLYT